MDELPVARGMFLCERVIVEDRTRNISLINCFNRRLVEEFPSSSQQFTICAALVNGRGIIPLDLRVTSLADEAIIYERRITVEFQNPLMETRFVFRVGQLVFPHAGSYEFSLLFAELPKATTRVEVLQAGV